MTPQAMLEAYYYFLKYRIDFVVLALLVGAGCFYIKRHVRRRGPQYRVPLETFIAAAAIVVAGGLLAEWMALDRVKRMEKLFEGFGPTYAVELSVAGHASITLDTAPDDPTYLKLIAAEKRWKSVNPMISDVYSYRVDQAGKIHLIVDSETDYNHDGRIEGDREERIKIGEIYDEATPEFFQALEGKTVFDSSFTPDRWGIAVSSFTPIYGPDGHIEAGLGVDYPADSWLFAVGTVRTVSLAIALVLNIILLISSTLICFLSAEIEERKQTQHCLEQARESAFEASAAKSEFLAVTSHEVRTPLNAILGFANILSDTQLDATQRRYLETMNHAGGALMDLLNSILDYTSIESGKFKLECAPWTPAILIHEVIETMSAQALQRGLTLQFDNHLPSDLTLNGDSNRIRQILSNLMGNSLKFTTVGSVTVRASWQPSSTAVDTGRITISVVDTGLGIRAEKIPNLFKAFAQSDVSTTRTETNGVTGLGLAISKRLADLMKGSLTVKSTPGEGSEFTLAFDCYVLQGAAAASTKHSLATIQTPLYSGRGLVVDDQRLNRELLKVMLRRCGLEADLAASGFEAIEFAAKNPYAIIFTDIEMPEMDGFATAERIRAAEKPGKRVSIVAISALTAKGTRERCIASGMDDYITKPVYLPALNSTLAALLATNGAVGRSSVVISTKVA